MNRVRRPHPQPSATVSLIIEALAAAALLVSITWMFLRTHGKSGAAMLIATTSASKDELMPPQEFHTETIIAMALSAACPILGLMLFYMGASPIPFIVCAVGTLLVDVLYILPKGIGYWKAWDKQQNLPQSPFQN